MGPVGEKFQVDLDELDGVVRRLKHLQADMDEPNQKIKYSTTIPKSAFGIGFDEAEDISSAHDEMQNYMTQVIAALQDLIRDFGGKPSAATVRTTTRSRRRRHR